ncbi:MAG: tryptophan synthase subunit alpha [Acidobacteria bacterium]|nr:tryptophan synthase subunit alpha [Acidobacteriota bacterium]
MNHIRQRFEELKAEDRKGFIPFITFGDPCIEVSIEIAISLAKSGADVIEFGVPFSDPMADGPVIQASSMRALASGANLPKILNAVCEIKLYTDTPIVLFSYLNPLISYGLQRLAAEAADAGVDGLLVLDAVDHEAEEIGALLAAREIDLISLVAPTTSDRRLEQIAKRSRGFIYAVSRAGVTGNQTKIASEAKSLVGRVRRFTNLPVAVGFGISRAQHIRDVWSFADAAVVGSAIVSTIASSPGHEVRAVENLVMALLPPFAKTET